MDGDRRRRLHRLPRGAGVRGGRASTWSCSTTCPAVTASSSPTTCPFVEGSVVDTDLMARTIEEHDVEGVVHLAGFKYAGVSVERPLHTYDAERHRHGQPARRRWQRHRRATRSCSPPAPRPSARPDVDLVTEETADAPGVAVRREQADRRVGAARPGARDRPAAHVAALLQRRRLRVRRPLRHQPAQPVPARLRDAARREDAADQRRPTTRRPTAPACATTCTSPTSPPPTSWPPSASSAGDERGARLQPRQRRRRVGAPRSWTRSGPSPASTSRRRPAPRRPGDPARIVASGELAARDLDWQMRHSLEDMVRSRLAGAQRREAPAHERHE